MKSVKTCFFAFFTLFHLSLTFFDRSFPLTDSDYEDVYELKHTSSYTIRVAERLTLGSPPQIALDTKRFCFVGFEKEMCSSLRSPNPYKDK